MGGEVASCFVSPLLDRTVRVRNLAGNLVLCYWLRHVILIQSNTLQPVNALGTGDLCPGKPCDGLASHPVMSKNTSSHLVRQNRDKPPGLSDGPLGSHADFLSIMQKALYILFLLFSIRLLMIALFYIFGTYTVCARNSYYITNPDTNRGMPETYDLIRTFSGFIKNLLLIT